MDVRSIGKGEDEFKDRTYYSALNGALIGLVAGLCGCFFTSTDKNMTTILTFLAAFPAGGVFIGYYIGSQGRNCFYENKEKDREFQLKKMEIEMMQGKGK